MLAPLSLHPANTKQESAPSPSYTQHQQPAASMATTSSTSSCQILDLAVAATLDDATSELFFSGGGDLSWPAAAEIQSTLTNQESLVALCHRFRVPRELRPVCAGTLGCAAAACGTPPSEGQGQGQGSNALCIYSDALEAGLRFPMPVFYQKLLRHYGLAPSQLAPNAWRYMAAFVQRCKDAGLEEPRVSAFRYFFTLCAHKGKDDKPLGWHHFRPHHRLFSGSVPATRCGWRTRFLYLEPPEGMSWKCPVTWGKPRREDVRMRIVADLKDAAAVKKLKEMPCVDLKSLLRLHDPPVGALGLNPRQLQVKQVKPEPAAAGVRSGSAQALPRASAAAAGEGDDSARRKRKCPDPAPGKPSALVPPLQRWFDGASASGSNSNNAMSLPPPLPPPPPGIGTEEGEQRDSQSQIAELQDKLQKCEARNDVLVDLLVKERNNHARLHQARDAAVARVKELEDYVKNILLSTLPEQDLLSLLQHPNLNRGADTSNDP